MNTTAGSHHCQLRRTGLMSWTNILSPLTHHTHKDSQRSTASSSVAAGSQGICALTWLIWIHGTAPGGLPVARMTESRTASKGLTPAGAKGLAEADAAAGRHEEEDAELCDAALVPAMPASPSLPSSSSDMSIHGPSTLNAAAGRHEGHDTEHCDAALVPAITGASDEKHVGHGRLAARFEGEEAKASDTTMISSSSSPSASPDS